MSSAITSNSRAFVSRISAKKGIELIKGQITKGKKLLDQEGRSFTIADYAKWELVTRYVLEDVFGKDTPNVARVMDVEIRSPFYMEPDPDVSKTKSDHIKTLKIQVEKLGGLVEVLEMENSIIEEQEATIPAGHKIFLVHGHDESILHQTARFLEKLEQETVILRELPNKGRTIIEKFEDCDDIGFAVVILFGDDRGGIADEEYSKQRLRARQNVIFELGYFIGKLGRNRVCALYAPEVEIPSDYSGVLFIPLDERKAWQYELAKEIKAAGLQVDMNLIL